MGRDEEWARAAVRQLLRRLASQAEAELRAEGVRALGAAARLKRWRV